MYEIGRVKKNTFVVILFLLSSNNKKRSNKNNTRITAEYHYCCCCCVYWTVTFQYNVESNDNISNKKKFKFIQVHWETKQKQRQASEFVRVDPSALILYEQPLQKYRAEACELLYTVYGSFLYTHLYISCTFSWAYSANLYDASCAAVYRRCYHSGDSPSPMFVSEVSFPN